MSDSAGEKKFDLSDKRRQELRQEGSIPRSHDVSTTTILAVGLVMLTCGGGYLIQYLREFMTNSFLQVGQSANSMTPQTLGSLFATSLWLWIGIFVGAIALAVFISQAAQVGFNFADDAFTLKLEKLNPLAGLQQIFSLNRLTQTGQSVVKLAVISSFAYLALQDIQKSAVFARPVSLDELGGIYVDIGWSFGWRIVTVLGVMAAGDYLWQVWKFNYDNRMTFEEVKEERRSQEMSPEVMKKRRMMSRKVSMRRMLENLEEATIVVTNPTHYAVALKYKRGETEVPIVVAKGIRMSALRIKERAYDLRIAVREDKPLARGLYKYGKIDKPIPAIFYQGVAVILASLYRQGFSASDAYTRPPKSDDSDSREPNTYDMEND
jgi:flagellar biosynthetic protein FlhB